MDSSSPTHKSCPNCGSTQTAAYCAACGQDQRDPIRSLTHWLGEYLGDSFTFDSRLFRSLAPLLLQPGRLTQEFIAGRRQLYIPPLRAYIFISLIYFLVAALMPDYASGLIVDGEEAPRPGIELPTEADASAGPLQHWIAERGRIIEANPQLFEQQLASQLPTALFLSIPLLAALLGLMYRRQRRYYIEHLVLCLHNHSAIFLLALANLLVYSACRAVDLRAPGLFNLLDSAVWLYGIGYIALSLRRVHGQGWAWTLCKSSTLLVFGYLLIGGTLLTGTVLINMARLT